LTVPKKVIIVKIEGDEKKSCGIEIGRERFKPSRPMCVVSINCDKGSIA